MVRLKDRQRQIPNGYQFYLPAIKWKAPGNFPSFKIVCDGLSAAIRANPAQAKANGWPTSREGIEDWVDLYNATLCARMGWDDYIVSGEGKSVPKSPPPHQAQSLASLRGAAAAAKKLVAGAKVLVDWIDSGAEAVAPEVALNRAIICSQCPHNTPGDFTRWFTVPASELIKRQVEKKNKRNLATERDDMLHLCNICMCPLKLKVWTPQEWIRKHLAPDVLAELKKVPGCWVPQP